MKPLTVEQQENLQGKLISAEYRGVELSDKDVEVLADILHTQTMLKVLGRIRASADMAAFSLVNSDLGKEAERHAASRLQGIVHGSIGVIDTIIALASLPEEEDNEQPATPAD